MFPRWGFSLTTFYPFVVLIAQLTLHLAFQWRTEGKEAAHLNSPSGEGLCLSVCPEGLFDAPIVYSSVLCLTLIYCAPLLRILLVQIWKQPALLWTFLKKGRNWQRSCGWPTCGMKHSRWGSSVLWIGLDCDSGAAAVLRMGRASPPVKASGQTSRRCTAFISDPEVPCWAPCWRWAPYVYRHVLSLFLPQNVPFVKLHEVIIIRNNADFHTKKPQKPYQKE